MKYTRLGRPASTVSRIALGCMSFGDPAGASTPGRSTRRPPQPFFRQAVELGITFWDTANVYQLRQSEEIVGRAIRELRRREDDRARHQGAARCTTGRAAAGSRARRSWSRSTPP